MCYIAISKLCFLLGDDLTWKNVLQQSKTNVMIPSFCKWEFTKESENQLKIGEHYNNKSCYIVWNIWKIYKISKAALSYP